MDEEGVPYTPLSSNEVVFQALVVDLQKSSRPNSAHSKFEKKLESIPNVVLPPLASRNKALVLAKCSLIGQFKGIFPSPKSMDAWVAKSWHSLIKGDISLFTYGKGFFLFCWNKKRIET